MNNIAPHDRVFIDSNTKVLTRAKAQQDPIPQRNKDREKRPVIKPAFPPKIKPKDLILRPENGSKPPRSPNAFIIYRKIFVETARADGYHLPMTTISSMASQSWVEESEEVRSYYKGLAKDAYSYRSEMYPKIERRKKRKRWNIVSFQSPSESSLNACPSPTAPEFPGLNDGDQISNQHFFSHETRNHDDEISLAPNEFYDPYAVNFQNAYSSCGFSSISSNSSPEPSNCSSGPSDFNPDLYSPLPPQNALQFDSNNQLWQEIWCQLLWSNQVAPNYIINTNNNNNNNNNNSIIMTDKMITDDPNPLEIISQFPFEVVTDVDNKFSNLFDLSGNLNDSSSTFNEMY